MTNKQLELYQSTEMIFFMDVVKNCKELESFISQWITDSREHVLKFVTKEQNLGHIKKEIPASFITYVLVDLINHVLFDPNVDEIISDFEKRVKTVVDCFVNGMGSVST